MSVDEHGLRELLRRKGLRVTSQRLLIHRALRDHGGHATSEQVYVAVADALPSVSHQTVYSTLALLADLGAARRVAALGPGLRFESRCDEHHHLVCERCGEIEDLELRIPLGQAVEAARAAGFDPRSTTVTLLGLCAACGAADQVGRAHGAAQR